MYLKTTFNQNKGKDIQKEKSLAKKGVLEKTDKKFLGKRSGEGGVSNGIAPLSSKGALTTVGGGSPGRAQGRVDGWTIDQKRDQIDINQPQKIKNQSSALITIILDECIICQAPAPRITQNRR